jgi:hypothetical protein
MALSIDELSSRYGFYGVDGTAQNGTRNTKASGTEQKEEDGDSYISTIANIDSDAPIPSENYNDFARKIKLSAAAGQAQDSTEYASVAGGTSQAAGTEGTQAAGGGGAVGGGSSDSEEDTETEVVFINGEAYLQTTTTDEDGNTTVTRTKLSAPPADRDGKENGITDSDAAQALFV